jgi:DNA-binding LacI/PurR family transcriptional regulator
MTDVGAESGLSRATVSLVLRDSPQIPDNIAEAELQRPPLTFVATYADLVGAEAARLLLERLDAPDARPRRVVLVPRLHVRASSTTRDRHPQDSGEGRS